MRKSFLLTLGLPLLLPVAAQAQAQGQEAIRQGPNGLSVNCADFKRQPDGSWRAGMNATLNYPDRAGSFAGRTFYVDGMIVNGNDIAAFLDASCGADDSDAN